MQHPDHSRQAPQQAIREARERGWVNSLEGKRFAITGRLSMTRLQIKQVIEGAGGRFMPIVTGADYLIIGEQQAGRSSTEKLDYARRTHMHILTEDEFTALLLR